MAIYRTIHMSFWTDNKVVDDFTPEDKYFYLYLCTNPQTNLLGCYEVSLTVMSHQTGYNKETIERLLNRFENVHQVIKYSSSTKEVLLLNWYKHNWTKSEKLDKPLLEQLEYVKNPSFKAYLVDLMNKRDTVSIPYAYPMDTSVTVTNTNTLVIKEIIDYLNKKTNSKYTYKNKSYNKHINARLDDGFTVDDFKTVIDKKCDEWLGDEKMSKYLTPDTLFAPSKFEKYLNQKGVKSSGNRLSEDETDGKYAPKFSLD